MSVFTGNLWYNESDYRNQVFKVMARAAASGQSLTYRDTRFVMGMLRRGHRQHDIAAYFGVNAGRIAEVATSDNEYPNAQPMPEEDLPPPGPYLTKFALQSVIDALNESIAVIEMAEAEEP